MHSPRAWKRPEIAQSLPAPAGGESQRARTDALRTAHATKLAAQTFQQKTNNLETLSAKIRKRQSRSSREFRVSAPTRAAQPAEAPIAKRHGPSPPATCASSSIPARFPFDGRSIFERAACGGARREPRQRSRTAERHRSGWVCAASQDRLESCPTGNDFSVTVLLLFPANSRGIDVVRSVR